MVTIDGHPANIPDSVAIPILIVLVFFYILPSFYNFWVLFSKAKKRGWAVLIPIYGPIVATQIAKQPTYLGVIFALVNIFQYSSKTDTAYIVAAIQTAVSLALGLTILVGLSRQYKAKRGFWILMVLLPIAAYRDVNDVKYVPKKSTTRK